MITETIVRFRVARAIILLEKKFMDLKKELEDYKPYNEQEEKDRELILKHLCSGADVYTRENPTAHLTASAWVVTPDRTGVLMAYHNIYKSWSWLGGHADGERDLRKVALREVHEESGLEHIRLAAPDFFSVEVLTVDGHEKHGRYVSSHLHLNVTFLIEADPGDSIHIKPDENSRIGWFSPEEAVASSCEPWFRERVYRKLNEKMRRAGKNDRTDYERENIGGAGK